MPKPHNPLALPGQKVVSPGKTIPAPSKPLVKPTTAAAPKAISPDPKSNPKSKPTAKPPVKKAAPNNQPKKLVSKIAKIVNSTKKAIKSGKGKLVTVPVENGDKPKTNHTRSTEPRSTDTPEIINLLKAREKVRITEGCDSDEYIRLSANIRYKRNPEAVKTLNRKNYPKQAARAKERYESDPKYRAKVLAASAAWRARNKTKVVGYNKERQKDPHYQGSVTVRNFIVNGLKKRREGAPQRQNPKFEEAVGLTKEDFQAYVEKQFTPKMMWGTFRKNWSFQFRKPLSEFDLSKPADIKAAANYKNIEVIAHD